MSVNNLTKQIKKCSITSDEELFNKLYKDIYEVCKRNNWGDPFSYSRGKEIYLANYLNHKVAPSYSGPDGIDCDGGCEYKTTIQEEIKASYTGISKHDTWENQVEYLKNEKIANYKNHYIARFDEGEIKEIYKMDGNKVLELLLPKLKKQFEKKIKVKTLDLVHQYLKLI